MTMNISLPKYQEPPPWIPIALRKGNQNYDNKLANFMPRLIYIKKSFIDESLGFNIRGGTQQFSNIFVSKVYPDTLAFKYGLNEADQLISVNGVDFRTISHFEAVKLFKEYSEFLIVAKFSPHDYKRAIPFTNDLSQ